MDEEAGWYEQDKPVSWLHFAFEEFIAILVLLAFSGFVIAAFSILAHGSIQ